MRLIASLVNHVCEQSKHGNIQACESQEDCFVGQVVQSQNVVKSANDEKSAQSDDEWREKPDWRKIHSCAQDQLAEP